MGGAMSAEKAERRERVEAKLRALFAPGPVEVEDESHLHAGHAGARGGASHLRALVVSDAFEGQLPVARQRRVYAALADEMKGEIHALALRTLTPAEWALTGNSAASDRDRP